MSNWETTGLPPEIWLKIFCYATFVPGLFLERGLQPSETQSLFPRGIRRHSDEGFFTKRSLVLVSKSWNVMAIPLLYECIRIKRTKSVTGLLEALKQFRDLGHQTKRLDIQLRANSRLVPLSSTLEDIVCSLPNLSIFTISAKDSGDIAQVLPDSFTVALGEFCGKSLRVFSWLNDGVSVKQGLLDPLLQSCPNLCYFRIPSNPFCDHTLRVSHLNMPRVEFLSLPSWIWQHSVLLSHNPLPALRHFEINSYSWGEEGGMIPALLPLEFLRVNGSYLHSVTISGWDLVENLAVLAEHCPSLQRLNLKFTRWRQFSKHASLWNIKHLGIRCTDNQPNDRDAKALTKALAGCCGTSLEVIQFNDFNSLNQIRRRFPMAYRHIAFIAWDLDQNICLMDPDGTVLEPIDVKDDVDIDYDLGLLF